MTAYTLPKDFREQDPLNAAKFHGRPDWYRFFLRYIKPKLAALGCTLIEEHLWTTPQSATSLKEAIDTQNAVDPPPFIEANCNGIEKLLSPEDLQLSIQDTLSRSHDYWDDLAKKARYLKRIERLQRLMDT